MRVPRPVVQGQLIQLLRAIVQLLRAEDRTNSIGQTHPDSFVHTQIHSYCNFQEMAFKLLLPKERWKEGEAVPRDIHRWKG